MDVFRTSFRLIKLIFRLYRWKHQFFAAMGSMLHYWKLYSTNFGLILLLLFALLLCITLIFCLLVETEPVFYVGLCMAGIADKPAVKVVS